MKNVFQSLLYTLLSVFALALLFPATKMLFDSAMTFWPDIRSDIDLGLLTLHKEMVQTIHNLFAIMRNIPWPFWTYFVIYFFATKKETKTSPRERRQWYKKWDGVIWPIYVATVCIWVIGESPDQSLLIVSIFLIITSVLLYYAFLAYKAVKAGRQFWSNKQVTSTD